MQQANYTEFDRQYMRESVTAIIVRAERCRKWRRLALVSFGLFMASVIGNIVLILGR